MHVLISTFLWLSVLLPCAAAVLGFSRFRQLAQPMRGLVLLAGFDAAMELTLVGMSQVLHLKSNLFMFPLVLTGELGLLALIYHHALQSNAFTEAAPWVVVLFGLYGLLDQLAPHAPAHYAPGVQVVSYLLILGMVGLYFRKLLNDLQVTRLSEDPIFWLSAGLTVYTLGNLLIALFSNYILAYSSLAIQRFVLLVVRNLFNVELYVCYLIALWLRPPKPTSLSC